eukprot:c27661_g4_i1 orf=855-2225(-)
MINVTPNPQLSNALKGNASRSTAGKRIYQVWKGSNRFFLGGRLIFGPDVRSLVVTLFLIIAPVVAFCVYVAKPFMHEFAHHAGVSIMVVATAFSFGILVLLLLTSGRDPGIVPRNTHPPEPDEDYETGTSSSDSIGQMPRLRLPRTKDVVVNGVVVKVKYCDTCMLYRPPRCSHCFVCNNCVERFDHHCPWVGQCIGRRNYPFFFLFVSSTTVLCIYVFAISALQIKTSMHKNSYTVLRAMGKSPASIVLMVYTFIAVWFVGGLTMFHLYLIGTNQTTYENFRYRYDNKVNPYDRGICHNFREIFWTAIPPSKNKFRGKVQQEISTVGAAIAKSVEARDMTGPNDRKIASDIEMATKLGWTSMVVDEAYQVSHGRDSNCSKMSMEMKDGFEETCSNSHSFSNEGGDFRGGIHPRWSSWGRKSSSVEITPDIFSLAPGVEGSHIYGGFPSRANSQDA